MKLKADFSTEARRPEKDSLSMLNAKESDCQLRIIHPVKVFKNDGKIEISDQAAEKCFSCRPPLKEILRGALEVKGNGPR